MAHGQWERWLREEVDIHPRVAQMHMKVADTPGLKTRTSSQMGLDALYLIATLPPEERTRGHKALRRMSESAVLRRSLLPGQRAAIVLEFTELVEELRERARERQRLAAEATNAILSGESLSPDLEQAGNKGRVVDSLAEKAGIGKSSMAMLHAPIYRAFTVGFTAN